MYISVPNLLLWMAVILCAISALVWLYVRLHGIRLRTRGNKVAAELIEQQEQTNELASQAVVRVEQLLEKMQEHKLASSSWERRFWEMHGIVERVLKERDEWRDMWRTHVAEHLEGQAILENKIVKMRLNLIRSLATTNRMIVERDGDSSKLVKSPDDLDPVDSEPVGQAERYYQRMRQLLMIEAPAQFDALMKRDELVAEVRCDDSMVVDEPESARLHVREITVEES